MAEFKFDEEYNLGDVITVDIFNDSTFVDVVGTSKGKGFQGVMKRHGFGGVGQSTHGQDDRARKPGSIGACSYPAKVFKGMRMAGHMSYPHLIQAFFNRLWCDPPTGVTRSSIWTWIDRMASGL